LWIDTLPNDNIAIEINDPSGSYSDLIGSGYSTATTAGGETNYDIPLMPSYNPPPAGNVTYGIYIMDIAGQNIPVGGQTPYFIDGASVQMKYGTTTKTDVSTQGIVPATFPMNTQIIITVQKAGYGSATKIVNSGPTAYNHTYVYLSPSTATPTPTLTGPIPTRTIPTALPTGNLTPYPTTIPVTPVQYTGFWGPLADALSAMGALPTTIGLLLAALLIFIGFCIGGWSGAAYAPGAPFNPMASLVGGVFGFVLSVAFGFIPLLYIIAVIFMGVFVLIFYSRAG
jgi:hypothetical protein